MSNTNSNTIRAIDLFSGMGGTTCGAYMAGVKVLAAVDTWGLAKRTYLDNFEGIRFYRQKCESLSLKKVCQDVGSIELLLASPECTSHSVAKGGARRSNLSRETAFAVARFARAFLPRWIIVENVIQMRNWDRYGEWLAKLGRLGYNIKEQILNAADFGVAQSRRRLFVLCDLETTPPDVVPTHNHRVRNAACVIDADGRYPYSDLRMNRRAEATLERAERAISALGRNAPFLLVYYGTDGAGGWQRIDAPLRTITTLDRFAYVRPDGSGGHEMRMLQVPELKKAMGFPNDFKMEHGTRRDRIKLLGNAVCPPVVKAVIENLTGYRNTKTSQR